jgi:hypothetical protein
VKKPDSTARARAYLATTPRLKKLDVWDVIHRFGLTYRAAEKLLNEAKLARSVISLADLAPHERRAVIEPDKLDLHAIAAGPIMDSNEIYLPAGKISMAEARAREQVSILEASI